MKKLFIIAVAGLAISLSACNSNTSSKENTQDSVSADSASAATIVFESPVYDFGKATDGDKVAHDFKFTNTGTSPLIITNASASCGCTVPDYPHEPIAPGASGVIKVVFDTSGKVGVQNKQVIIASNAATPSTELFIKGEVQSLTK
jgi:outer membrane biosynthesis protein TonB